jgi:hypothetical protein
MHELRRGGKKIVLNYDIIRMHYANNTSLHSDSLVSKQNRRQNLKLYKSIINNFVISMSGGLRNIWLYVYLIGTTTYKFLNAA